MKKKDFKTPSTSDIYAGNTVTLYDEQGVNYGEVLLIEERPSSRMDNRDYVKAEIGGTDKQDAHLVIWTRSRWLVQFADGWTTARYVHYFKEEVEDDQETNI